MAKAKKSRVRKNFMFPADLAAWAQKYAKDRNTSLTQVLIDHLTNLRKQAETGYVEQV